MRFGPGRFRFRRKAPHAPTLDPPGYRRTPPPPPPPPPAPPTDLTSPLETERSSSRPAMRLMLADGTLEDLPDDPEMEARAAYLIHSILPPAPPPPPGPGPV